MKEDYLHYIWKFQKFNPSVLKTEEGENIIIKKTGIHNTNSGPDFLESNIIIGETEWFGSIEIHLKSSDWDKHSHQHDKSYNNVILHVVFENDKTITNNNGQKIPTLVLKPIINKKHIEQYNYFIKNGLSISCQRHISNIDSFIIKSWLERLLLERLERKTFSIYKILDKYKGDWEQTLIHFIMRYFGMKINNNAMEELSTKTPYNYIKKEKNNLTSLEALLFGQAGMLNDKNINDNYYNSLRKEYLFIKQKYKIYSIDKTNWKFSRLRPPNFPTIRIAQLAMFLYSNNNFFENVREFSNIKTYTQLLKVSTSNYWKNHYVFNKECNETKNTVGDMLIRNIIINVISPISFAYGKYIQDERYCDYSTKLLSSLSSEKNSIVYNWKSIGIDSKNAITSQSLIELYSNYCKNKKCLHCAIGVKILQ